jgi:hypothetical protein
VSEEKGMRGRGWRAPPYLPYQLKTMQFSLSGSKCTIEARKGENAAKRSSVFSSFIAI